VGSRRAVVFAGETGDQGCLSVDRTCGYINFFTSARAARAWAGHHPAITGTVLSQVRALRGGVAEFGAFLRTRDGTTRPDRTLAIGSTGPPASGSEEPMPPPHRT
jgi:Alkylmercury lyase